MKLSIQKICFILLFIVLSTIIMIYGGVILKPIAFALLAASIYLKPAQWVERRGIGRSWSIIIVMLTGSILVLSFGYFLANETVQVMTSLKSELSMDKPSQMIANEINDQVPNGWVQLTKDEVSNTFKNWMSDVGVPFLSDTFKSTGYILSSAILCLLYTFFLLLDLSF